MDSIRREAEMGYSDVDRAGDTDAAKRREKAPAVPFLTDSGADPASLDPDALSRWLVSQGFFDADTDQAKYVIGRLGYDHLLPYLVAVKESRYPEKTLSIRAANELFTFDRRYQSILLENIGLLEVQVRAAFAQEIAAARGPYALYDPDSFRQSVQGKTGYAAAFARYEEDLRKALSHRGARLLHQAQGGRVPVWSAVEAMSFGTLSQFFSLTRSGAVRSAVAERFCIDQSVLVGWLRCLTDVRNVCAHYGVLCGRQLSKVPKALRGFRRFKDNRHPLYAAVVLARLLRQDQVFPGEGELAYGIGFCIDVVNLFSQRHQDALTLGFPENTWEVMTDRRLVGCDSIPIGGFTPGDTVTVDITMVDESGRKVITPVPARVSKTWWD